jgi:hypothetical protein
VAAAVVNGTIDDQRGDSVTGRPVLYYPADSWNDQTCGSNKCAIVANKSQATNNTYTAATYNPNELNYTTGPASAQSESQVDDSPPFPRRDLLDSGSPGSIGISMQFSGRIHKIFFV